MKILIHVPYPGAEKMASVWAEEEKLIDYRKDFERAARCTVCFAAVELRSFLKRTISNAEIAVISDDEAGEYDYAVFLRAENNQTDDAGYTWKPDGNTLLIQGKGRIGVLYGCYEFLRLQGWRWYAPGPSGEIAPAVTDSLCFPEREEYFSPAFHAGRGFLLEGLLKESYELWLWMARNRLDFAGSRAYTHAFMRKLGLIQRRGGHIFTDIMQPDYLMPSGKTLWEEHPKWFGLPKTGVRKKETALQIQPCAAQRGMIEHLAEELLRYLNDEWAEADEIDVWGFDTWGSVCTCEECAKIGNSTDQYLHIVSGIRAVLNQAIADGRLKRKVRMAMCAYEGTCTLEAPTRPVPQNLIDAGDYVLYAVINRCYAHDFDDMHCSANEVYRKPLGGWCETKLPIIMLEYYNVSKFEDLPIMFTKHLANDMKAYAANGVVGMTYMHTPLMNWGMRRLTQSLYARLTWNPEEDVSAFLDDYYQRVYRKYGDAMKKAYDLVEEAWKYATQWRAWGPESLLSQLLIWDGRKPEAPLGVWGHFTSVDEVIQIGNQATKKLQDAFDIVKTSCRVCALENACLMQDAPPPIAAKNPGELGAAMAPYPAFEREFNCEANMREDLRLLKYGAEVMELMNCTVAYHNALYREDTVTGNAAWKRMEELEDQLNLYDVPLTINGSEKTVGFAPQMDAMSRSQLREVLRRCRAYRFVKNLEV